MMFTFRPFPPTGRSQPEMNRDKPVPCQHYARHHPTSHGQKPAWDEQGQACPMPTLCKASPGLPQAEASPRGQGPACPMPTLSKASPDLPRAEASPRGQGPACPMPTLSKASPDLPRAEASLRANDGLWVSNLFLQQIHLSVDLLVLSLSQISPVDEKRRGIKFLPFLLPPPPPH